MRAWLKSLINFLKVSAPFIGATFLFLIPEYVLWRVSDHGECVYDVILKDGHNNLKSLLECQQKHQSPSLEFLKLSFFAFGLTLIFFGFWRILSNLRKDTQEGFKTLINDIAHKSNTISNSVSELRRALANRGDFTYAGTSTEAGEQISRRFLEAKRIYNMHVPFGTEMWRPLNDQKRISAISEFLKIPGNIFEEIVGREAYLEFGLGYLSQLSQVSDQSKFSVKVTDQVFPFLNFTVLEFVSENGEVDHEVWFGWGGYAKSRETGVYYTRSGPACDMFRAMFNSVEEISSVPDRDDSLIAKLISYRGFWVDVAVRDGAVNECALLKFGFDAEDKKRRKESRLCVHGIAFVLSPEGKPGEMTRRFRSLACEIRGEEVHVTHHAELLEAGQAVDSSFGYSVYRFSSLSIEGYMFGEVSSPNYQKAPFYIKVRGKKLNKALQSELERIWALDAVGYPVDHAKARKLIGKDVAELAVIARQKDR